MRLVYISHWRFPSEKTMSPLIMKTCEVFARAGIEVELWVPWRHNPDFSHIDPFLHHHIERNFTIHRLPTIDFTRVLPGTIGFFIMLGTFNIAVVWYALLRRLRPETIIYAHDERDLVLLLPFFKRFFLEIHDFYKSNAGWLNKLCLPQMSGLIVTNRFKMQALKDDFGIEEKRMLHQPNAVDVTMFSGKRSIEEVRAKLNLSPRGKIVLYTGHLFGWKGVDTLLQAAPLLSPETKVYFLGGTDEDIEIFKEKARDLGAKNVIIAGRKSHAEIPLWQRAANVLVLPNTAREEVSRTETSPVKLFEYMASETPIVASDLPAIRNVVDETMVTFFEPDNPEALAKAIQYVLAHVNDCKIKAKKAYREVQQYSWELRGKNITAFMKVVQGLLGREVLVLGDDSRAALACVRSLGRRGVRVVLGTQEQDGVARSSRYVSSVIRLPSNSGNLARWESRLQEIIMLRDFELIIPAAESTFVPIALKRALFSQGKFALPSTRAFDTSYYKEKTIELARELAVPVSETTVLYTKAELSRIDATKLSFPLIAKPNVSKKWESGFRLDLAVKTVHRREEFETVISEMLNFSPVLLQNVFPGIGVGQEFLCRDGKILYAFQHERVHEPAGSGGSSLRKSVPLDLRMYECSKKILENLLWTGAVMIEYRYDPETKKFVLLEINGRLWGSLPLALAAGVDFPWGIYRLFTGEKVEHRNQYAEELYARNLVNDLKWVYRSAVQHRVYTLLKECVWAAVRWLTARERWDTFVWDDPLPAFAELWHISKHVFVRVRDRLYAHQNFSLSVELEKLKKARKILFVCSGNISRSAFAEQYARQKFAKEGRAGYVFSSTGFHTDAGRSSPPAAQRVAEELGVSLNSHRSQVISREAVLKADLIFYMDEKHLTELKQRFPEASSKIIPLGALASSDNPYIHDPWGEGIEKYRQYFTTIKKNIDQLFLITQNV